jgi:acetylornithine deacetylase
MIETQASAIDETFVTRTLQDLVRINSVNPSISPEGKGEAEIACYLAIALRDMGLEVAVHEPQPARPSVVGILRGSGGGHSLMLNAHIDTVGVEGMSDAFSGAIRGRKLFGRGAYDMKGSVAACVGAMKALSVAETSLPGDVLVALVADEEFASIGSADLLERYRPDAAIVTEPSALQICVAHKGFIWLEVETTGRAYHGSQYEHGIDANMRMGRFLNELEFVERDLRRRQPHPYVGPPSLHAATLRGGTGLSIYAASATLQIERRTIPGESTEQAIADIAAIIERLSAQDDSFKATMKTLLVRSLASAATNVLGDPPKYIGENPWMDSALLSAAGVETVVFGPDGTGAHSDDEWVDLDTVARLSQILADTAVRYCSIPKRAMLPEAMPRPQAATPRRLR